MHVVIIGSGIAGVTAARTVRERAPDTQISIFTDENHWYYPKPKLYEVLSGEAEYREIYAFNRYWYEERRITVHFKRKVLGIEPLRKEIYLEDGSHINYDRLLLANGASPFIPPIHGVEKNGVFTLRSLNDALNIQKYAKTTRMSIVIGGGLLGLEMAICLRKLGLQVDIAELFPRLLPRQLDQEGASLLKDRIEARGINVMLGVKTEEILGNKSVSGILLDNGKVSSGNLVLISAGVRSNTLLAASAGIKVDKGVIVDKFLQTSSNDVYAAGDVAEFKGRVYGIIPAAIDQAKIAAMNMVEEERQVYKGTMLSNTLKIVGIDLISIGLINPEDDRYEELKTIDKRKGIYRKIVLEQGKIVGAIVLGEMRGVVSLKKLMDREIDVTKYRDSLIQGDFDQI
jgi:nitrite reductase (NADH) large subunit